MYLPHAGLAIRREKRASNVAAYGQPDGERVDFGPDLKGVLPIEALGVRHVLEPRTGGHQVRITSGLCDLPVL